MLRSFDLFSKRAKILPIFCMVVEDNWGASFWPDGFSEKNLHPRLWGVKCPKKVGLFYFFGLFSKRALRIFLIFCMIVEDNRGHHFNVVSYLGKFLIRGLRGIKCQKFGFLDIVSETGH